MKTIDVFYQELLESGDLQTEMMKAALNGKVEEFFSMHDCAVNEEEIWDYFRRQISVERELSDEELAVVSGGAPEKSAFVNMLQFWMKHKL